MCAVFAACLPRHKSQHLHLHSCFAAGLSNFAGVEMEAGFTPETTDLYGCLNMS